MWLPRESNPKEVKTLVVVYIPKIDETLVWRTNADFSARYSVLCIDCNNTVIVATWVMIKLSSARPLVGT